VQYLENSLIALRAVHYTLRSSTGGPEVQLFPLVHIASAGFYSQVRSKLNECDVILYEGVRSLKTRILTLSYRIVARRKRLGLVCQRDALPLRSLRGRLVHGDVSTAEFNESWTRLPLGLRIVLAAAAPAYGAFLYLTASRESIGRRLSLDDLPSREDVLQSEKMSRATEVIGASRDAKLVSVLEPLLAPESNHKTVGVLYGAQHMIAVTEVLMGKHSYKVAASEWLNVFDYPDA
jgi:hypothetical protein